ncbi:MAG TPA: mechanosensitive ion channel family protein [Sphingorhabdus lacus]|jgi:small-conductance mechanosensitive channel|uniref:Mechanosensitive ion channel family protein n=1 Tax=Sphingorhabdus lacus TaxID=392610 RepID=A0A6I6LBB5_9SPHN|nr:mechanosensitive ion channel family protein [Sphingorhabdus lacus]QGY81798.1 mechanosensitive ion channel family protein [Sphingorhabdus lacus]HNW17151.1 mechanosensitive ion channel family protein [Sphingorhabdus lacus]HPV67494.1 mechanosensitive ion channel family protein [Sphingorhabdus lacus]
MTKPTPTPSPRLDTEAILPRLESYWTTLVTWVEGNAVELGIAVAAAVVVFLLLSWLKRIAAKVARESEQRAELKSIIARTLARTSKFFRVMVAVEVVNRYANAPDMLTRTVDVLFTIAVTIQIAVWLREIILGLIERRVSDGQHERDTLASAMVLIRLSVSFALFAIAAIVILDNLGVNVTGLIAGLGVGGIAIGLAAQGIFSDLFAAISIIFDKPFRRGDTVTYDTTTARVEKIGMKSTRLRALTGEEKIIANSKLLEKEITNNTLTVYRRVVFPLSLVYQTPPAVAAGVPDLLKEIVEAHGSEFIRAGFSTFGPSSLDFQLVFDVNSDDVEEMFKARHAIGIAIVERFARDGIEFAYPTQTTFTAAPDGTLVMPYAPAAAAAPKARAKG